MNLLKWSLPIALGVALVTPVVSGRAANSSTQIGVKDRANAYASIDARGQFAALTWGASTKAGATDIYVAVSRDGGRAFAPPTRVNGVAGDASLSGEQPPQIVLLPRTERDPSIVVMWTSKAPTGTKLLTARSDDGGKSFASSGPVSGSDAPGNRGWQSIAASRDGGVAAVWLDHRELAAGRGSAGAMNHSEPGATSSSEPTLELFYAMSEDGRRFTARQRIPTVGVPRHPQMTLGVNDELLVAWDEQARGTRHVAVARGTIDARGKARFVRQPIGDGVRAEYPVLSTVDDGTIVAWTSGPVGLTTLRVERLVN